MPASVQPTEARVFRPWNRHEVHLFVLWSEARRQEDRILADLTARFVFLDVIEVTWTADATFARNLTRMYGDALPPGSDKELHCGTGPFLAVVVEDQCPRYRVRRTGRGRKLLNSAVFDARYRYRTWTGGGYRVHATDSVAETRRNLALLFGMRPADFQGAPQVDTRPRFWAADPVGTSGWDSVEQLGMVLGAFGGRIVSSASDELVVTTPDLWWAEHIAGGRDVGPGVRVVVVGTKRMKLILIERRPYLVRMLPTLRRLGRPLTGVWRRSR